MRQAKRRDRARVIEIITHAFRQNPTMHFMVRNNQKLDKYIKYVAGYAFDLAIEKFGVYLSDCETGAAICYLISQDEPSSWKDLWAKFKLAIQAFALRKILLILNHAHYVADKRPKHKDYLYFWFFGVINDGIPRRAGRDLAYNIMKKSDNLGWDIYAETTLRQNKIVYERFGFKVYHKWTNPDNGITVWFMSRKAGHELQRKSSLKPKTAHLQQ